MVFQNPEELRRALKASKGRALVLVHPFCGDLAPRGSRGLSTDVAYAPSERKYVDVREALLRRAKIPVIIFEEHHNVRGVREMLSASGKPFFFVSTGRMDPTPQVGWHSALKKLNELGLKHAIVGGKFLEYRAPTALQDFRQKKRLRETVQGRVDAPFTSFPFGACVGETMRQLFEEGVKVTLMPNGAFSLGRARQKARPSSPVHVT